MPMRAYGLAGSASRCAPGDASRRAVADAAGASAARDGRSIDGTAVSINACTVLTLVDGKFADQRIYVDNAPVAAALG